MYANPDIPVSSSSPFIHLWFSSSPTVLSWCITILNGLETEVMMSGCAQFANMYLILSCRFSYPSAP